MLLIIECCEFQSVTSIHILTVIYSGQFTNNSAGTGCICLVTGAVFNAGTGICELGFCPKNAVTIFLPGFYLLPGYFVTQPSKSTLNARFEIENWY